MYKMVTDTTPGRWQAFFPLVKADQENHRIYAVAAAEELDRAKEIMDYVSAVPEFQTWSKSHSDVTMGKSLGNVRAMHNPRHLAGKVEKLDFDDEKKTVRVCIKVLDPVDWLKVEEGGYTGISIGGGYRRRWDDPVQKGATRYTPRIGEISLVDAPCIESARFLELQKMDGSTIEVPLRGIARVFNDLLPPRTFNEVLGKSFLPPKLIAAGEKVITNTVRGKTFRDVAEGEVIRPGPTYTARGKTIAHETPPGLQTSYTSRGKKYTSGEPELEREERARKQDALGDLKKLILPIAGALGGAYIGRRVGGVAGGALGAAIHHSDRYTGAGIGAAAGSVLGTVEGAAAGWGLGRRVERKTDEDNTREVRAIGRQLSAAQKKQREDAARASAAKRHGLGKVLGIPPPAGAPRRLRVPSSSIIKRPPADDAGANRGTEAQAGAVTTQVQAPRIVRKALRYTARVVPDPDKKKSGWERFISNVNANAGAQGAAVLADRIVKPPGLKKAEDLQTILLDRLGAEDPLDKTADAAEREKVRQTMHEFKGGKLRSWRGVDDKGKPRKGPKVTDRRQAIAIALSQARRLGKADHPGMIARLAKHLTSPDP